MRALSTERSWGWVARVLHWTMAVVIFWQLGLGTYMANAVEDLARQFALTQAHKSWGVVAFALLLARLAWRAIDRHRPEPPAGAPAWERRAARASHALLYVLMAVMPVSGWVYASASPLQDLLGIDNEVFGRVALPDPWVPGSEPLAAAAHAVHVGAAVLLAGLLALHVAAALRHEVLAGDGVLARMSWGR
jgi:cytochrome b561